MSNAAKPTLALISRLEVGSWLGAASHTKEYRL